MNHKPDNFPALIEQSQISVESATEKTELLDLLKVAGVNIESFKPDINLRLQMENENSRSVQDARQAMTWAIELKNKYNQNPDRTPITDLELKETLSGILFSDIGKTGPLFPEGASEEEKRDQVHFFLDIYRVGNIPDIHTLTLENFFVRYYPQDADTRKAKLRIYKVEPTLTLREFYNLHTSWTLDIIDHDGVPEEAVPAAALHHILEGQNPKNILGKTGEYQQNFNANKKFDRPEMLVIILDKLDAFRSRGNNDIQTAGELTKKQIHERIEAIADTDLKTFLQSKLPDFDSLLQDILDIINQTTPKTFVHAAGK